MHKKFQSLLHEYKLHVFHNEHDKKSVDEITSECLHITEDVLKQKYHYHFNKLPDANRAEIINMINNYVRDAVLPPIVEKMVMRQIKLERRFDAMVHLFEHLLETLSQQDGKKSSVAS